MAASIAEGNVPPSSRAVMSCRGMGTARTVAQCWRYRGAGGAQVGGRSCGHSAVRSPPRLLHNDRVEPANVHALHASDRQTKFSAPEEQRFPLVHHFH